MLFNEEMMVKSLENFVEKVFKKHSINNVDSKDVAKMILEELEKQARKKGKTSVGLGIEDEELEKAVIKAPALLETWKKSKDKKETKTTEMKKTETKTTKAKEKKEVKEEVNEQIELIDFSSLLG